jgi:uncharacterized SAM-binding protein YcdF (DUF218 family)
MTFDWGQYFYQAAALLLSPPGLGLTLMTVFGLLVLLLNRASRKRSFVRGLFVASLIFSFLISCRVTGYALAYWIEGESLRALVPGQLAHLARIGDPSNPLSKTTATDTVIPQAIVVLGGGIRHDGREKPHPNTLNSRTAQRVHYGAYLAKSAALPLLVSGGFAPTMQVSEASVMARVLKEDYNVEVRWIEEKSLDTYGNARESAALLKAAGITRIVLVTQAYHMRRSALVFEAQGLQVLKAPVGFIGGVGADLSLAWLPSASGIESTYLAGHEAIGLLLYRLRGWIPRFSY